MKKIIYAISVLSGTIIGVGFFALPYIASKVGVFIILGYFLILGPLVIILHLFFGELSLATPDFKRLPGFAKIYLGSWGQLLAYFSTVLGLFGAALAYLIVGGEFLGELLSPVFGGGNLFWTLIYFSFGAILIFFGIKIISQIEFWGLILFFASLIVIFCTAHPAIKIENLSPVSDFNNLFLPYGVILFSLWGAALIPEVEEMLGEKKNLLRKIIPISIIIPIIIYLFFIYLVLGVSGPETTESAFVGLQNFLDKRIISLGLFFGIVATFTSFIALGLTLKKIFWYDLRINKNLAWLFTCLPPLFLFLVGVKNFIPIVSLIGGVMLGIDGILIVQMYRICKKIKRLSLLYFLTLFLTIIFILGIFYAILYFLKGV